MPQVASPNPLGMETFDELAEDSFDAVTHVGQEAWIKLFLAFGRLVGSQKLQALLSTPGLAHFSHGDLPLNPVCQMFITEAGKVCPFQVEDEGHFVLMLPAGSQGLVKLQLESVVLNHPAVAAPFSAYTLSTSNWQLNIDPSTGGLTSLVERSTGREWVDSSASYTFGQLVHESIVHPLGREAIHTLGRYVALGVSNEAGIKRFGKAPVFAHGSPQMLTTPQFVHGPVFDQVVLQGHDAPFGQVQLIWRCYHAQQIVELIVNWNKNWSHQPEAGYVAFPFAAANGQLKLETGGGFFQPGNHERGGQLPGTCANYYTIQRAAEITSPDGAGLVWLPLDAPLVMPNAINYANWEPGPWTWNGFLASMPVNHYWVTNFAPSQRGPLHLRYRLLSSAGWPDSESAIQAASPREALGWR